MKIATAKIMRDADKSAIEEYGLPELALMESAGHRTAEVTKKVLGDVSTKSICILAGSGNNGGDALAAARYLANAGARLKIFLVGNKDKRTDSLNAQIQILRTMGLEVQQLENDRAWERLQVTLRFTDAILDGILGTGFSGEMRPAALRLVRLVNTCKGKPIVSIDIPSGVDADSGAVGDEAINATCTVTFGLPKIGHFICPGAARVGELFIDDIGLPAKLLDENIHQTLLDDELAKTLLPPRDLDAHKGSCGKILVVAGSRGMTGAASLASLAALKTGAGVVTLAVPESLNAIYETKLTEVITAPLPENKPGIIGGDKAAGILLDLADASDAVLIGCGLGRDKDTLKLIKKLVETIDKPLILDADALFAYNGKIDELKACKQIPILTPHLGELSALLNIPVDDLRKDLVEIVRMTAKDYRAIIVAKAECTVAAYPNGEIFVSPLGNSGMATAGSGDVLAGAIAGLMKQTPFAPLAGVYLHGTAGDLAAQTKGEGLIASDISDNLPAAILKLRNL